MQRKGQAAQVVALMKPSPNDCYLRYRRVTVTSPSLMLMSQFARVNTDPT